MRSRHASLLSGLRWRFGAGQSSLMQAIESA